AEGAVMQALVSESTVLGDLVGSLPAQIRATYLHLETERDELQRSITGAFEALEQARRELAIALADHEAAVSSDTRDPDRYQARARARAAGQEVELTPKLSATAARVQQAREKYTARQAAHDGKVEAFQASHMVFRAVTSLLRAAEPGTLAPLVLKR